MDWSHYISLPLTTPLTSFSRLYFCFFGEQQLSLILTQTIIQGKRRWYLKAGYNISLHIIKNFFLAVNLNSLLEPFKNSFFCWTIVVFQKLSHEYLICRTPVGRPAGPLQQIFNFALRSFEAQQCLLNGGQQVRPARLRRGGEDLV